MSMGAEENSDVEEVLKDPEFNSDVPSTAEAPHPLVPTTEVVHHAPQPKKRKHKDQDSWKGSTGHSNGDVQVYNLGPDPEKPILCRRAQLYCNGVDVCEFIDPELFEGCERYEPDMDAMRELWNHELDANENEAASAWGIISRFYSRVVTSKCKIKCEGVPTLILRSKGPSAYGKRFFVGCSKWSREQRWDHIYWEIPANVDENTFTYLMQHDGQFPDNPGNINERCVLTVHPRVGLSKCPYSHIVNGQVRPARMKRQPCPTKMLIFIPVDQRYNTRAIVILRNAHNHPAHPHTKPTAHDKAKLESAIQAAGVTGLTVQRLLNAPSTLIEYDGSRVAQSSPAFIDTRKVRDVITQEKKKEYPRGMGWDGVLHELEHREMKLREDERYIHTAMSKNGFRIVVTMHPYIAMFIHRILSLNIDYTFARVEDNMDEWEVAGFLDRFKHPCTVTKRIAPAFAQLFTELFDTIREITGNILKIRPFYPDANCRVVLLDGEVPQAQGFGDFLSNYNDPDISKIYTRNWERLLRYTLKTCSLHFIRHIEELGQHIPQETMIRLRSIVGLETQEEIDDWYEFVDGQTDEKVQHWLAHKRANPWVLPSVNKFLSKIASDDWDITPNHTNYVETAHAGRNAETSIGVPLLTAILQAKERDNIRAKEMAQIESHGMMRKRWNGIGEREKHAAQRKGWRMRKAYRRNDALIDHDSLITERDIGDADNKASLERQSDLEAQIKALKAEIALDKHRTDLPAQVADLRRDIDEEKALRREWGVFGLMVGDQQLQQQLIDRVIATRWVQLQLYPLHKLSAPKACTLANLEPMFDTEQMLCADESATTLDPIDPGDGINFSSSVPAIFYEGPGDVTATELPPIAENSIPNFNLPSELGLFSVDDSMQLSELDLVAFDEFLAAIPTETVGMESVTHIDSGQQNHGFEYEPVDVSNSTALRLSQELPRLPPPPVTPSPSQDGFDDVMVDAINADSHATTAPRDIDLELSERNILSGKRRRTQSTRLADAATGRPRKKGARD
ncbi:hypothetical protein MSAN_00895300 [Mycena sanguinolenta]|uniref:Uncharacterized protein n=1 Tax=Mycena sanguinolenta TaxID=230812 RepID=A0A8H7DCB7_9AGAR|nr:hypothetical protein MSAN_00895300 [Mycena sanguinolenta]